MSPQFYHLQFAMWAYCSKNCDKNYNPKGIVSELFTTKNWVYSDGCETLLEVLKMPL